jgi:hypothetical protein
MRLPAFALSVALLATSGFAGLPARAASEDAVERNVDRMTTQQDAKDDDQQDANPCKGITRSSTQKQKKACADFMQQQ